MTRGRFVRAALALSGLVAAQLLGVSSSANASTPPPAMEVAVGDHGFTPSSIQAAPGTALVFRNTSATPRGVAAADGRFDSGPVAPGQTWSWTVDGPATVVGSWSGGTTYAEVISSTEACVPEIPCWPPFPPSPSEVTYGPDDLPAGSAYSWHSASWLGGGGYGCPPYAVCPAVYPYPYPGAGLPAPLVEAADASSRHRTAYHLYTHGSSRNPVGTGMAGGYAMQPVPPYVRDGDGWILVTAVLHRKGREGLSSLVSYPEPSRRYSNVSLALQSPGWCPPYAYPEGDPEGTVVRPMPCPRPAFGEVGSTDSAESTGAAGDRRPLDETITLQIQGYVSGGYRIQLWAAVNQAVSASGVAEATIDQTVAVASVRIQALDRPVDGVAVAYPPKACVAGGSYDGYVYPIPYPRPYYPC